MPTNEYQWFFFLLYTIGSVGGLVYIATWIVDRIIAWRGDDSYDPWAEEDSPSAAPTPVAVPNPVTRIEPPISARTK